MEEPGEQCTVVFALIVTEPASECVCRGGGGGGWGAAPPPPPPPPPPPTRRFRNNLWKDDSALFFRFLHGWIWAENDWLDKWGEGRSWAKNDSHVLRLCLEIDDHDVNFWLNVVLVWDELRISGWTSYDGVKDIRDDLHWLRGRCEKMMADEGAAGKCRKALKPECRNAWK